MSGTKFKPQHGLSLNVGALVLALPGICCMTLNESLHSLCFAFSRGVLSSMLGGEDVNDQARFSVGQVKGT